MAATKEKAEQIKIAEEALADRAKLAEQVSSMRAQMNDLTRDNENIIVQLRQKVEELDNNNAMLTSRVEKIDQLQTEKAALEQDNSDLKVAIQSLSTRREKENREEVLSINEKVEELNLQLSEKDQRIRALELNEGSHAAHSEAMRTKMQEMSEYKENLKKEIQKKENKIQSMKRTANKRNIQQRKDKQTLKNLEKEIAKLKLAPIRKPRTEEQIKRNLRPLLCNNPPTDA